MKKAFLFLLAVFALACLRIPPLACAEPDGFGMTVSKIKIGEGKGNCRFWSNGFHGIYSRGSKVYAVWATDAVSGGERVLFAKSLDGGLTWSGAKTVSLAPEGTPYRHATMALSADAATGEETIHVVWQKGSAPQELLYSRSTTEGETWSAPVAVNKQPDYRAVDVGFGVATDGRGNAYVAWTSPGDENVYISVSPDGEHWRRTVIGSGVSRSSKALSLGSNGLGHIVAAWDGNDASIYFAKSSDGVTWSEAVRTAGVSGDPSVAAHPADENKIYIGVSGSPARCLASTDGGRQWTSRELPSPEGHGDISLAVSRTGEISAAVGKKLLRSRDGCLSWVSLGDFDTSASFANLSVDESGKAHIMWAWDSVRYTREK